LGRWSDRLRRPLLWYAVLETGIGLFALASPRLLSGIDVAYVAMYRSFGQQLVPFAIGRALLAGLFLLPPTLAMGATLPLVLRAAAPATARIGRISAILYGINTLGAVAGTFLAGFVTIRLVGLYATLLLAAAANLVAALGALVVVRDRAGLTTPASAPTTAASAWLRALFFAMGATSLAYEVFWTRILVFYLGSSVYAYALMLGLVLLGIGAGSLAVSPWADRIAHPLRALGILELGIGLWIPIQVLLVGSLNRLLVLSVALVEPRSFWGVALAQVLAVSVILGPPTFLMGASFPLAVRAAHRHAARLGRDVGDVYGWNTLGAVVGSLGAGFLLIPLLGTQTALLATGAANGALGAWLVARGRGVARGLVLVALPVAIVTTTVLFPADAVILSAGMFRHDQPEDLVYFHEDAQASVTIRRLEEEGSRPYLSLELNGVNVAGTSPDLYAVQKMQGHLPLLLSRDPESVVHIGFGSGATAWAVSRHAVEEILVVEISPEVLAASDRFFADLNHGVLQDPRVEVEINDGRNFVLASPRTFSAVLSDSIHPRYAGNGSLYTLEYFRLLARRVRPGGTVSMWLPMYSLRPDNYAMILRAFHEVFPHVAVWYEPSALNAFTVVTGKLEGPVWSRERLAEAFRDPRVAGELEDLDIRGPEDILSFLVATEHELAPWLALVPPHGDDLPAVEYESSTLLERDRPWLETFAILCSLRPAAPPARYLEALHPVQRSRAQTLWQERGALMHDHLRFLAERLTPGQRAATSPAGDR
jgi:spermidine synthase